jgi:hypothetical protein
VDFEGQDYLGNVIDRPNGNGGSIPYDDHRLFLGGAASSDDSREPEWLINPETTDRDKRPLDPRAALDWLVIKNTTAMASAPLTLRPSKLQLTTPFRPATSS